MMKRFEPKAEKILTGVAGSGGIAIGRVFRLCPDQPEVTRADIEAAAAEAEIARLQASFERTKRQLDSDKSEAQQYFGDVGSLIFEVQRLILEDPDVIAAVESTIRNDLLNADYVFDQLMRNYIERLTTPGGVFEHREADLQDVRLRVIRNLRGEERDYLNQLQNAAIVVTDDLKPSSALLQNRHKILAFATDLGGKTSHAVIMLRSYGVPAVVGLREITKSCQDGDRLIVDGFEGLVLIKPDEDTLRHYQKRRDLWLEESTRLGHLRELPARTLDGKEVGLSANIEFADEVELVMNHGGDGVGLFRTEFLYIDKDEPPTEEEQYLEYSKIVSALAPRPAIIRTLDLGGDKIPRCIPTYPEANPFLGWRAIRICLDTPELFKTQVKAVLRASVLGNAKLLLPMISSIQEIDAALALVEEAKRELARTRQAFKADTEIGVMIEVPSAAVLADLIAERVDFLSIGTNDLVQYTLAVDRGNERVAHLLNDLNPAVLRLIRDIIVAAHSRGVWVGICGEMAADKLITLLLVGMEIDSLSMSPIYIPQIKKIIRSIHCRETRELVDNVFKLATAQEIREYLRSYMRHKFRDMMF